MRQYVAYVKWIALKLCLGFETMWSQSSIELTNYVESSQNISLYIKVFLYEDYSQST